MVKAAKIFIYITFAISAVLFVFGCISIGLAIKASLTVMDYQIIHVLSRAFVGIAFLLGGIIPFVVGLVVLKKLKYIRSSKEATAIAIVCLILCNALSGILLLLAEDEDFDPELTKTLVKDINKSDELKDEIEKLNKMKEDGLLSEQEYTELRKKLIDSRFDK